MGVALPLESQREIVGGCRENSQQIPPTTFSLENYLYIPGNSAQAASTPHFAFTCFSSNSFCHFSYYFFLHFFFSRTLFFFCILLTQLQKANAIFV